MLTSIFYLQNLKFKDSKLIKIFKIIGELDAIHYLQINRKHPLVMGEGLFSRLLSHFFCS